MAKQSEIPKPKLNLKGFKPLDYLRQVRAELKKVDWPTREQAIRLTSIVIGVSVITALFLGGFDYLFTQLAALVIQR